MTFSHVLVEIRAWANKHMAMILWVWSLKLAFRVVLSLVL